MSNGHDKFEGRVEAMLNVIGEDIKEIKLDVKTNAKDLSKVKIDAAKIAGIVAILISFVLSKII